MAQLTKRRKQSHVNYVLFDNIKFALPRLAAGSLMSLCYITSIPGYSKTKQS